MQGVGNDTDGILVLGEALSPFSATVKFLVAVALFYTAMFIINSRI
jgi:hypothetical protein